MTSTADCTSHTHPGPAVTTATNMTSCSTVPVYFTQRPNTETKTPEHKTLNNALVPTNKVLSITWKLSVNHAPLTYIKQKYVRTILSQGSKLENQHTRKTLGTLSWVYKPSGNPIVFGAGNPCWSYRLQDLPPTKTVKGIEVHIPPPKNAIRSTITLVRQLSLQSL